MQKFMGKLSMRTLFPYKPHEDQPKWLADLLKIVSRVDLKERTVKKALFHTAKVFQNKDYMETLKIARELLKHFTFTFTDDLRFEVIKPETMMAGIMDTAYELFSVSPHKGKLTKRVYLVALSQGKIVGWLLLSPPPGVLGVRTKLLPHLKGGGRKKDGLEGKRGKVLNRLASVSQVRALGAFRKARGVKALYTGIFTESIYPQVSKLWKGLLGVETLSMYEVNSNVFRNLQELCIYHEITEGFSDLVFPQAYKEDFRTTFRKNHRLMRALKSYLKKGYFLISTLPATELDKKISRAVLEDVEDFTVPTLSNDVPLKKLKLQDSLNGEGDMEFWLSTWKLEEKALREESYLRVFEMFLEFYEKWEALL